MDKGVADVSIMVDAARETTEAREGALREQVNASLSKIRAYARDMEVRVFVWRVFQFVSSVV